MRKVLVFVLLAASVACAETPEYKLEKLADGVFALIRQDPVGWMVVSNCVFIINDEDVVVVDTGGANSLAKQMITELRKLTNKPVRYVINTHWHDDHILGNAAYKEAFPQAEFVAHAATREYLPTKGVTARKSMEEGAPAFAQQLQASIDKKESLAGGPLSDEERTADESDIKLVNRYLAEGKDTPIVLPTITVEDRWTLYRGDRAIDVRYLGRAHTSGDIVVHLPKEGIAATIVPGHGPVLHDDKQLDVLSRMFTSITQQIRAGIEKGQTLEEIRKSIDLNEFKLPLADDSTLKWILFANYVRQPATASAYADLRGTPTSGPVH